MKMKWLAVALLCVATSGANATDVDWWLSMDKPRRDKVLDRLADEIKPVWGFRPDGLDMALINFCIIKMCDGKPGNMPLQSIFNYCAEERRVTRNQ